MKRLFSYWFIIVSLFCFWPSAVGINAFGQAIDLHSLSQQALSQGAYGAATYLLYADYLKNPEGFKDLEVLASLLVKIEEYSKADSILMVVDTEKRVSELSDSLQYLYYSTRAKLDYHNNQYISSLKSLSKITLNDDLSEIKAFCLEEIGLFDNALQVLKSLDSPENRDDVNCLIGDCYKYMGKYPEAIECYSKAINDNPGWGRPYYEAGWSYELAGDDMNALKYYNDGLSVDQSNVNLYLMRGMMYNKMGQIELAKEDFNAILLLDKTPKGVSRRHYALFFLGRNDDAMNWMNRVIEYQPNRPGHYYDKACLCCRMGLEEEAIKAMEIAFEKGYRHFAHLDADDDIDPIKNSTDYRALYDKYYSIYQDELEQLKDIL